MRFKRSYSNFLNVVDRACYYLIGIMMAVMVSVMAYQVVLRYLFDRSNLWSEEIARYLCVYVTFIGSFMAIRRSSHLKVEFFVELIEVKARRILALVLNIAITVFLVYMIGKGIEMTQGGFRNVTAGLNMPMAYVYFSIPLGCALMIFGMIEQIAELLFPEAPSREEAASAQEDNEGVIR